MTDNHARTKVSRGDEVEKSGAGLSLGKGGGVGKAQLDFYSDILMPHYPALFHWQ